MSLTVLSLFEQRERVGQRHFAMLVMVAVGFAIGGHAGRVAGAGAVLEAGS